jgi:hypothetical protein
MNNYSGNDEVKRRLPPTPRGDRNWPINHPSFVFKYGRADEHTISLLRGELHFSPPNQLNDPRTLI